MWNLVRSGLRPAGQWRAASHAGAGPKICILGAAGATGRLVSLLLKSNPLLDEIALYDEKPTNGLATQLNRLDSGSRATAYCGCPQLKSALMDSQIVLMIAGKPKTCKNAREDLADENAPIVAGLAANVASYAPNAFMAIATDPLNVMVPLVTEIYRRVNNCVDHNKIFGITTLDVIRVEGMVASTLRLPSECICVPVVGGHTPATIVPILSQTKPPVELPLEERVRITRFLQGASDEVMVAKKCKGPTFAAAFAIARFVDSLARALSGRTVIECALVKSEAASPTVDYIATPLEIGPPGVQCNLGIPVLSDFEETLLETALQPLSQDIYLGKKLSKTVM